MARKRRTGAQRKRGGRPTAASLGIDFSTIEGGSPPGSKVLARACRPEVQAGPKMNQTERRYETYLGMQKQVGLVASYTFEPVKFRLGPNWKTAYMPDFLVVLPDGIVELHEVKGASKSKGATAGAWWEEDARLKIKMAAGLLPFRFVGVHENGRGGWAREVFPPE